MLKLILIYLFSTLLSLSPRLNIRYNQIKFRQRHRDGIDRRFHTIRFFHNGKQKSRATCLHEIDLLLLGNKVRYRAQIPVENRVAFEKTQDTAFRTASRHFLQNSNIYEKNSNK